MEYLLILPGVKAKITSNSVFVPFYYSLFSKYYRLFITRRQNPILVRSRPYCRRRPLFKGTQGNGIPEVSCMSLPRRTQHSKVGVQSSRTLNRRHTHRSSQKETTVRVFWVIGPRSNTYQAYTSQSPCTFRKKWTTFT